MGIFLMCSVIFVVTTLDRGNKCYVIIWTLWCDSIKSEN